MINDELKEEGRQRFCQVGRFPVQRSNPRSNENNAASLSAVIRRSGKACQLLNVRGVLQACSGLKDLRNMSCSRVCD